MASGGITTSIINEGTLRAGGTIDDAIFITNMKQVDSLNPGIYCVTYVNNGLELYPFSKLVERSIGEVSSGTLMSLIPLFYDAELIVNKRDGILLYDIKGMPEEFRRVLFEGDTTLKQFAASTYMHREPEKIEA